MRKFSRRQWMAQSMAMAPALVWPLAGRSQGNYPNKPVRVIVPFAAGGTTDVVARLVLQKLSALLGQSFVVENKGGANGIIGTELAARATPDGYTLLLNTAGAQTLSPVLYKTSYEALESFEPITHICDVGFIVIARQGLKANTMQELASLAANNTVTASSGSSMINLITEQLKQVLKTPNIINAQYKGTSGQVQAVVAGEVDFSLDSFVSVPMIRAGRVKALAVLSSERSSAFPDVPTLQELGIHGMEFNSWSGLLAPKGTPAPIVDTLAQAMDKIMQMPDVLQKLRSYDYVPKRSTPTDFAQLIARDHSRWVQIVKETGFSIQ